MPIRPEFRDLYPPNWREISNRIRFERAEGRCEHCGRPHLQWVTCMPDGRWRDEWRLRPLAGETLNDLEFEQVDEDAFIWRDALGQPIPAPMDPVLRLGRKTRVVLAACHRDHNPRNSVDGNLLALCQRCHLLHDRDEHDERRRLTFRRRRALGDLFLGPYPATRADSTRDHPRGDYPVSR